MSAATTTVGARTATVGVPTFRSAGTTTAGARTATVVVPTFRSAGYCLSFALFICALLSKSVTATLPAALLVVLWWRRGRLRWQGDVRPLVPWFAVSVIAGWSQLVRARHHRSERHGLRAHASSSGFCSPVGSSGSTCAR